GSAAGPIPAADCLPARYCTSAAIRTVDLLEVVVLPGLGRFLYRADAGHEAGIAHGVARYSRELDVGIIDHRQDEVAIELRFALFDEDVGRGFLVGVDPLHCLVERIHESLVGLRIILAETGARPQ